MVECFVFLRPLGLRLVTLNGHTISLTVSHGTASGVTNLNSTSAKIVIASNTSTGNTAQKIADTLNQIILQNSDLAGNYSVSKAEVGS